MPPPQNGRPPSSSVVPTSNYILCLGGDDDVQLPKLLTALLAHVRLPRGWEDVTFVCLSRQAGHVSGPRLLAIEDAPPAVYSALLAGASAALCLSPGETSLPALRQALGAGLPTIAADTPAGRNVGADAALYVTPYELTETASELAVLLGDNAQRGELNDRARRMTTITTWQETARQTLALLAAPQAT
jgi:glycosyltransferase involved in cell wall biosynthesis